MENVPVLVIQQVPDQVLDRIANVDRRVKVVDARGWFDVELRATWPQWTVVRYLGSRKYPATTVTQRNQALALAEIMLVGWPPVKDILARAPRLKWVHELPAGASNFLDTDLWGSDIIVTTSRGLTNESYYVAQKVARAPQVKLGFCKQRRVGRGAVCSIDLSRTRDSLVGL